MTTPPAVDPSRVAMMCIGDERYGVGTVVRRIAAGVPGIRYVCFIDGELAADLRDLGQEVLIMDRPGRFVPRHSLKAMLSMAGEFGKAKETARQLEPWLRERGVDLIHTHWLPQQMVSGYLRKRGFRTVWHIHNNTNRKRMMGLGFKLNHKLTRWGADRVLAVSGFIADNWRGAGPTVSVIHNAAEPLHDQQPAPPTGPVRCVVAGRIDATKGHHIALDAVLQARARGVDIGLDIWGGPLEDNAYADGLKQTIAEAAASDPGVADAVRLMGFRRDLRERHVDYHLGLQCRIDPEPCSMWVCETLVDGLPIVASATGGTPELIEDGVTGILVPPGDPKALADALVALAGDADRIMQMRDATWQRGQAHYRIERFHDEIRQLYQELLPS